MTDTAVAPGPRAFDFRRPSKLTRDHSRVLQIVGETFARQASTVLSTTLRVMGHLALESVEQLTYDEFVGTTPNPSYLAILGLPPIPGAGLLHVPLPVALELIERLLGGPGGSTQPSRALTEIEVGVLRDLVMRLLGELTYAFEGVVALNVEMVRYESNPQFAQAAAATEMMAVFNFRVRIGGLEERAALCLPLTGLQPVLDRFIGANHGGSRADKKAAAEAIRSRLTHVSTDVHVRFRDVPLTSSQVLGLRVGDVIPLHHPVDEPLTLLADNVPFLHAVPGRRGKRLACLVVESEESAE